MYIYYQQQQYGTPVFNRNNCGASPPTGSARCNYATQQQLPPVNAPATQAYRQQLPACAQQARSLLTCAVQRHASERAPVAFHTKQFNHPQRQQQQQQRPQQRQPVQVSNYTAQRFNSTTVTLVPRFCNGLCNGHV
jgi:hypothetical protein